MIATADTDNLALGAINFARLHSGISVAKLQQDIAPLLSDGWVDHVNKNDYQGVWDVLPLRCQRQYADSHPVLQGFAIATGDEWQNLPLLHNCPAIAELLNTIHCPLKSVRLMRLKAGAVINPHRDHELGIQYGEARLHMPIQTNADILFTVSQQPVPMRAGELWYINADHEHAVKNFGDQDRINLVIDCVANPWLIEQIVNSALQH